jgi:hypothetical protein
MREEQYASDSDPVYSMCRADVVGELLACVADEEKKGCAQL